MKNIFILFIVISQVYFYSYAQGNTDYDGFQVSLGASFFHGDVGAGSLRTGLNLGLAYRNILNKKWSVRPKINYTSLSGDDATGNLKTRNLSFKNKTFRGELSIIHNFIDYDPARNNFSGASPYIGLGLGGITNNPTTNYEGTNYELQGLTTEGVEYSRFTFYIPISLGINIHLNSKTYIGFECTFHYVFSDYLDDVSKNYINNDKLDGTAGILADRTFEGGFTPSETTNGITWSEGSQRGSNNSNDYFSTFSFHLGYSFHKVRGRH